MKCDIQNDRSAAKISGPAETEKSHTLQPCIDLGKAVVVTSDCPSLQMIN